MTDKTCTLTSELKVWEAAAEWAQQHIKNAANYSTTVCRARAMGAYIAGYAFAKKEKRRVKRA